MLTPIKRKLSTIIERLQFQTAVKSGVAGAAALFFGVWFANALNRPNKLISGLWTVVTALVVIQAYLGGTYTIAWERFLGTLIGSLCGSFFTMFLGSNAFSLAISIFLTVLLCSLFNIQKSIKIATISVAVVMVLWGLNPTISPWTFGTFRFLDSFLGILIAVVIAHLLWPMQATRKLRLTLVDILKDLNTLFSSSINEKKEKINHDDLILKIISQLMQAKKHLETSHFEIRTRTSLEDWDYLLNKFEQIFELILNFQKVSRKSLNFLIDQNLKEKTFILTMNIERAFDSMADTLNHQAAAEESDSLVLNLEHVTTEVQSFRENRSTRKLSFDDAEAFFVFFYTLKNLVQQIIKLDSKIAKLYKT